jgi:hypothetical protein
MSTQRVFISHNHLDVGYCRAFVAGLRGYALDVWYDEQNVGAGALRTIVEHEIATRPHFIVILSPAAVASQWVAAEIDMALDLERQGKLLTFLPVVAVRCETPLSLRRYRQIVQPDGTPLSVADAITQTVRAILMGSPGVAVPPPAAPLSAIPQAPAPSTGNNGVIVGQGGTIVAGNLAVGDHAQAFSQTGFVDQRRQRVDMQFQAVVQSIKHYAAQIHDASGVQAALAVITAELAKPQPNKMVIQGMLTVIMPHVQHIGAIQSTLATFTTEVEQVL